MGLVIACQGCGKPTSADVWIEAHCPICRGIKAIADDAREYGRLFRKWNRYKQRRANVTALNEQIWRLRNRMAVKLFKVKGLTEQDGAQILIDAVKRVTTDLPILAVH